MTCPVSRSQSPDYQEAKGHEGADAKLLNSSLTAMEWLPKLNARAGVLEEFVPYSYASLIRHAYYRNQTNLG